MKPNQIQFFGVLLILSVIFSSCWLFGPSVKGNGNVTEVERNVGSFDQIEVSRGMNVYITQGPQTKVVVVADENLQKLIKTKEDDGVLRIYSDGNIRWAKEKKVLVTVTTLSRLESSSGANIWSQNRISADNLEIGASSGSNITLELDAKMLETHCSSGSNVYLSGLAKEGKLKASSGSNLKCPELKANRCSIKASSGSNVSSGVVEQLEAEASSGGNIVYYGEPVMKTISSSSGGSINKN